MLRNTIKTSIYDSQIYPKYRTRPYPIVIMIPSINTVRNHILI